MDFDPMMFERAGISVGDTADRPASHRIIGISLAIGSGFFIGVSFVMKKFGLLRANEKYNEVAGEGYGYLKNAWWWGGMTLMIVGEICNVVAYAFTDAIIVTSLGALTVVIATILSAIFLKERLSLIGKVSCFLCIVGSIVIVMNAPHTGSVKDIQTMQSYVIHPLFLSYTGVVIVGSLITALWAGPKWGNKNMLVYISVCSWVGGLSVVSIQGLGAAVVAWAGGKPQYKEWFMWVLLVFVIVTLLVEIVYLNKALNIYNAAMVTPTYYVYFTTTTIVTSAILFRGFQGTAAQIVTFVLGFLTICSGVVLLQLSKAAKDVPDAAIFKGDLDQIQTIAEQEQPESEPKADAIRGAAAIVRRISSARLKMESQELKRLHEEKMMDQMQPINENGQPMQEFEWDGLRRRKTLRSGTVNSRNAPSFTVSPPPSSAGFPASPHPPLGMSRFPDHYDEPDHHDDSDRGSIFSSIAGTITGRHRARTRSTLPTYEEEVLAAKDPQLTKPVPLAEINPARRNSYSDDDNDDDDQRSPPRKIRFNQETSYGGGGPGYDRDEGGPSLHPPSPPPHTSQRSLSFRGVFHRSDHSEEERLGLVKGDRNSRAQADDYDDDSDRDRNNGRGYDSPDDDDKRRSQGMFL
ncbi:unnamed protein product [Clonostachys chloroleuca]|uniref:Magnesium transporter NIPA2 n=1 Tax=Clonostachys chloroleuca TaxID=1926264 RepID=A0AA35M698_9HYPO|nr:unnamed protein product [Clonostachys chloroleuca]